MQKIKIVTLNVGYYMFGGDFVKDPNHNLENICRRILDRFSRYNPDILCIQEDLIIKNSPIFESIYNEYGYKKINYCESFPLGTAKLGNVIYSKIKVKKGFNIKNLDSGQKGCISSPRCATSIVINGLKLANVHLCGGPLDNKGVIENKINSRLREKNIRKVVEMGVDIIVGDLNSSYCVNYGNIEKVNKFDEWRESALEYLFKNGYKSAYKYYKTGTTFIRKNCVFDWVFFKNVQVNKTKIIRFYGKNIKMLSDHHAILVEILC